MQKRITAGVVAAAALALVGGGLMVALPAQALTHAVQRFEDGTNDGETNDDGVEDGTDDGETADDNGAEVEDGTNDGETNDDGVEDGTNDGETDDDGATGSN